MREVFSLPLLLLLIFVMALMSFFFSASETAIIALSKLRLRNMIKKGIKRAANIHSLVTKLDKFIAAILIGNDFVNIAISALVTGIFVRIFGYHWGVALATFVSTFFVLIFCEITPKILATKHTEKVALTTAPFMEWFIKAFHPLIIIFTSMSSLILKLFRVGPTKRSPLITEEELRLMIEVGKEEGVLSDEERRMLHRIFEFGDIKLSDVMVSKDKIIAVDINSSLEQVLDIFSEEGHARLPVYRDSIDNIVGIVYARDLLYIFKEEKLFIFQDILHEPYYASGSLKINELLRRFQVDKVQIAIVTDEKKQTLGLVTLEDLIEEIVGEIEEKHGNHIANK
ncbi:MAG: HlyC/CorC family transporter [Candidatus Omnitrophica bacterium]|nr:HlyC/CorC family transporter [Candidatus Omnitrophota bacterium]